MILVVDDKPENLLALKSTLTPHGFRLDTAESGEEALRKILKNTYSLIILDVQMPGMDGFEVAEAISGYSRSKDTPIIFLSAVITEKRFITKGYASGCIDYVTKPVDPDILLLKVKTFYALSEQRRELIRVQTSLQQEVETRKRAQDELEMKIEELHSVMESLPQIAFTLKENGAIEYVNEEWYKYSPDAEVFPEARFDYEDVYEEWQEHLRGGNKFAAEIRIKELSTGLYRHFLLRIMPIRQHDTIAKWVGTFTDIQHQQEVNEMLENKVAERTKELMDKNEQLEVSNAELQQFAWVASHDLKEPLRKIQTYNYLIKDKLEAEHDIQPYLERTIRSSQRMSQLIDNLLNFSRLSANGSFQPVDLNTVLSEIVSDLEISIAEKNATINAGPLPTIEAEPSQMRQVFQNLISNSLKFTKPGVAPEITIHAEYVDDKDAELPAVPQGDFCRITITDNGIGFNERYLDRIFNIFQRLHDRKTYDGTGVGLAITKKIIDKHNGIITARSRENEGASFIVVLPVKQNHQRNSIP